MTPKPSAPPPALPFDDHRSENFEGGVQQLIAAFLERHNTDPEDLLGGLHRVFRSLSYELGRVDGALRLHGVERMETLDLLKEAVTAGKSATLAQHEKNCSCEASKVLQAEIELN